MPLARLIFALLMAPALPLLAQTQDEVMTLLTAADYTQFPYLEPDHRYQYGDDAQQFAELYLPAASAPDGVIVLAHGGCYYDAYDLKPMSPLARSLADAGFAVWNIEYRRAGAGGQFPNMFLDAGAAADYLREVADEHDLDLDHVISVGHSAGGHLALWLAARHQLGETSPLYRPQPLPIAGVAALAPIADIADALDQGTCGPALPFVLGGGRQAIEANLPELSPAELLPLQAPQAIIVGAEDELVAANAQRYAGAAEAAGDAIELITLEQAGHFEVVAVDAPAWSSVRDAIQDLRRAIAQDLP